VGQVIGALQSWSSGRNTWLAGDLAVLHSA
jgi:hypothetical protein